ncbi:MAG TPA: hypothetical protein VGB53_05185 [Rubricoccaceae bacterium]|jgi:hypothetical protein
MFAPEGKSLVADETVIGHLPDEASAAAPASAPASAGQTGDGR